MTVIGFFIRDKPDQQHPVVHCSSRYKHKRQHTLVLPVQFFFEAPWVQRKDLL